MANLRTKWESLAGLAALATLYDQMEDLNGLLQGLDETMEELDHEIGLERLHLVHANDSKGEKGSRLDRHQHIGQGTLGMEAFGLMANHPALIGLPWILETPEMTVEWDRKNMQHIRSLIHEG